VRLVLEGSREGFKRIEALYRSGQLAQKLGVDITDIRWEGTLLERERSTRPRRLAALVCFLRQSYRDAVDSAGDMFDKLSDRRTSMFIRKSIEALKAEAASSDEGGPKRALTRMALGVS
jgi:hypothetical protein